MLAVTLDQETLIMFDSAVHDLAEMGARGQGGTFPVS